MRKMDDLLEELRCNVRWYQHGPFRHQESYREELIKAAAAIADELDKNDGGDSDNIGAESVQERTERLGVAPR